MAEVYNPPPTGSYGEPPKRKTNTTLIIIIVVAVILCCCCAMVALGYQLYFEWGDMILEELGVWLFNSGVLRL